MADDLLDALRTGRALVADGAMGTMLQRLGLAFGACPEAWNVERPDRVRRVHAEYVRAGSDLVLTNTFGGSRLRLATHGRGAECEALNTAAVRLARAAAGTTRWVIGTIGPFGGFLPPHGDADLGQVEDALHEQARALVSAGVDGVLVETQLALEELRVAVRAARTAGARVVLASFAFDRTPDGVLRTVTGVLPETACEAMLDAGVDVVGVNCGKDFDLAACVQVVRRWRALTDGPILAKPNAGSPVRIPQGLEVAAAPTFLARHVPALLDAGATILGGCCGTRPEHVAHLARALRGSPGAHAVRPLQRRADGGSFPRPHEPRSPAMNPLGVDPAYAFWNAQLERLGTRDPIDVLASTADELASLLATYGPEAFRATIDPGKWRPVEVLGHLLDIEWVLGFRARTILADEGPVLAAMDQDRWVATQDYARRDPHELWELFRAARTVNVEFWRRVPRDAWQRTGHHAGAKIDLSLELVARIHAGHDLQHLDRLHEQLERRRRSS